MWTALLANEVIDLERMSASDKTELRQHAPDFKCRGCKGPVHTRHIADGNDSDPFLVFAHNPGAAAICRELGFHIDESDEHHRLKALLAGTARRAGWTAELEVPGDRCRADVVVTNGTRTRVLEAQLSALSLPDAIERNTRYTRSFGDPLWTHTRRRDWSKQIPSIRIDDGPTPVVIGGVMADQAGRTTAPPATLTTVVPRILNGTLRYIYDADEQFGFHLDLAAATDRPSRTSAHPPEPARGAYVRDTCDRPPLSAASTDVTGRQPCDWCGLPTARITNDRHVRHGWCEETRPRMWANVARPPRKAP